MLKCEGTIDYLETWKWHELECSFQYSSFYPFDLRFFYLFFFQNPEEKGETEEVGDASKSEISLVYEIALKRNLSVNFEVRKIVSWAIVSHKQFHLSVWLWRCDFRIIGTIITFKLFSSYTYRKQVKHMSLNICWSKMS